MSSFDGTTPQAADGGAADIASHNNHVNHATSGGMSQATENSKRANRHHLLSTFIRPGSLPYVSPLHCGP